MSRTLVIAEPGCTHEGEYALIVKLIHAAADAGADVFKPQWVSDPVQMCERRHIGPGHPKRAYYERAYGWLAFPLEWHLDFKAICTQRGMRYGCTAFLPQDVPPLRMVVDYLKISSFECGDSALRDAWHGVNRVRLPLKAPFLIVSAGMAGDPMPADYVLHCVSAYPAPLEAMNLRVLHPSGSIFQRRKLFGGLSDHSRHLLTGAVAVACGASIVETHFRLHECDPKNPDYAVAFNPDEFRQYVRNIRDAELMLGDGIKRLQDCEHDMLPYRVNG